jgi:hypothetical protein
MSEEGWRYQREEFTGMDRIGRIKESEIWNLKFLSCLSCPSL